MMKGYPTACAAVAFVVAAFHNKWVAHPTITAPAILACF